MGPRLILDKSALQMLGAPLIDELTLWADVVTPPILWRELISNLGRTYTPKKGKRIPLDVLQSLAGVLQSTGKATSASFRKLVVDDLNGRSVEMNGVTIPVDATAANVHSGGRMLMVDGTVEQQAWARWARGDFRDVDNVMGRMVRSGVESLDPKAIGEQAKPFATTFVGDAHDIETIVARVNARLETPDPYAQARLCGIILAFIKEDARYGMAFTYALTSSPGTTLLAFAPYATSVLRLYLVFTCALALGIIKRDANSFTDLQYLFYAPFCGGFASNDDLHRRLFPAVAGPALFITGAALKADLEQRLAWRESLSWDEWATHRHKYGIHPIEFPGSIINAMWDKSMIPRGAPRDRNNLKEDVAMLNEDPKLEKMVADMHAMIEASKARKRTLETAWPLGSKPEIEPPL